MTPSEIAEWLEWLPFAEKCALREVKLRPCANNQERISVLRELLYFANQDSMAPEDRVICRDALRSLEDAEANKAASATPEEEEITHGIHISGPAHRDRPGVHSLPDQSGPPSLHHSDDLPV